MLTWHSWKRALNAENEALQCEATVFFHYCQKDHDFGCIHPLPSDPPFLVTQTLATKDVARNVMKSYEVTGQKWVKRLFTYILAPKG